MSPVEQELVREYQVAGFLADLLGMAIMPKKPGKDYASDFMLISTDGTRKQVLLEVKCDLAAERTGNIYLETFNTYRGEKSGLRATLADFWAHYIPSRKFILIFDPARMLEHLESHQHQLGYHVRCGGDNNSRGMTVPINTVLLLPFVKSENFDHAAS